MTWAVASAGRSGQNGRAGSIRRTGPQTRVAAGTSAALRDSCVPVARQRTGRPSLFAHTVTAVCLSGDHDRRLCILGAHDHVRYAWDVAPSAKQRRRPSFDRARETAGRAGRPGAIPSQYGYDRAFPLSRKGAKLRLGYESDGSWRATVVPAGRPSSKATCSVTAGSSCARASGTTTAAAS